jgi:hypothetical protein
MAEAAQRLLRADGQLMLFSSRRQANALTIEGLIQTVSVRLIPEGESHLIIFKRD